MIPCSSAALQANSWQNELARAISRPEELLHYLELPLELLEPARQAGKLFPLRVPWGFAERMRKGDPGDPLLRQVLPLAEELFEDHDSSLDPVGDLESVVTDGLLHKYHGRVLMISTAACGIHCRYCFRRHFPYAEQNPRSAEWQASLKYIQEHSDVEEVILSGGDPLSLSDQHLMKLVTMLEDIPHVKRLRIHSRMPIVLPSRVDTQLLGWLRATRLECIMVLHSNHAAELDETVAAAMHRLRSADMLLLNQAVLLRGVNDTLASQCDLQRRLISLGILPYYLHKLDRVTGATHFDIARADALRLMKQMRQSLPGYMMPRLVEEIRGKRSKLPLMPELNTL
jgi:EF-P beta-lysylation protein EpmB